MTDSEEWRGVVGWPDYEVSSLGRVRRATPWYTYLKTDAPRLMRPAGYLLKPRRMNGYPTVLFPVGEPSARKFKNLSVHILVCEAFHGRQPSPAHEVAHWDGDSTNARADNLRWATRLENAQDTIRHGRTQRGANHRSARLDEERVRAIRRLLAEGRSTYEIGRQYGVTYQSIQLIRSGRNWAWVE